MRDFPDDSQKSSHGSALQYEESECGYLSVPFGRQRAAVWPDDATHDMQSANCKDKTSP